jgi:hypothetical protein
MRKGIAIVLAASIGLLACATTAGAAAPTSQGLDEAVAALPTSVVAQAERLYSPGMLWVQTAKFCPAGDSTPSTFGESVALSGDTALVGGYTDSRDQGAAYVFVRSGTGWKLQAKLTAADGAAGDVFGTSVALSGDTALVGASYDGVGDNENQGSAYVFVRSGTDWSQQAKLTAADGAPYDRFGESVALAGDTALVGAGDDDIRTAPRPDEGSVYVFLRSGGTWNLQQKLTSPDLVENDHFGAALAISGETALVGTENGNMEPGAAYVFTRAAGHWDYQAKLTAPDGAYGDQFGDAVALSGDTAIVGVANALILKNENQGSAHVFVRSGSVWTHQAQLLAADGDEGDFFGIAVALNGDTALIGASSHDARYSLSQGSAYVFVRSGTDWTQEADLTKEWATGCGMAVALSSETALLGASERGGPSLFHGVTYVFSLVNDVAAPTTKAFGATVKRGKNAKLTFRVGDPAPTCGRAVVVLRILKGARVKKVLRVPGTCACNVKKSYAWKCTLPKGRYTLKVFATDLVGHRQSKVGSARLTVK